jgi:hypothetical protein
LHFPFFVPTHDQTGSSFKHKKTLENNTDTISKTYDHPDAMGTWWNEMNLV